MAKTFVVVDVETPGPAPAELVSFAAVVVRRRRGRAWMTGEQLYVRIDLPRSPRRSKSTRAFWAEQDPTVRAEALDPSPERVVRNVAAHLLESFARDAVAAAGGERAPIFVASPAGFDCQWVDDLMQAELGRNVFGFARCACARCRWACTTAHGRRSSAATASRSLAPRSRTTR